MGGSRHLRRQLRSRARAPGTTRATTSAPTPVALLPPLPARMTTAPARAWPAFLGRWPTTAGRPRTSCPCRATRPCPSSRPHLGQPGRHHGPRSARRPTSAGWRAEPGQACDAGSVQEGLPVALAQSFSTTVGTELTEPAGTLQSGVVDSNPGAASWTAELTATATDDGTVVVYPDGLFTYTPALASSARTASAIRSPTTSATSRPRRRSRSSVSALHRSTTTTYPHQYSWPRPWCPPRRPTTTTPTTPLRRRPSPSLTPARATPTGPLSALRPRLRFRRWARLPRVGQRTGGAREGRPRQGSLCPCRHERPHFNGAALWHLAHHQGRKWQRHDLLRRN